MTCESQVHQVTAQPASWSEADQGELRIKGNVNRAGGPGYPAACSLFRPLPGLFVAGSAREETSASVPLTAAARLPQQTAAPSRMLSSRAAFLIGMATPA